jgi:hypothetical protein
MRLGIVAHPIGQEHPLKQDQLPAIARPQHHINRRLAIAEEVFVGVNELHGSFRFCVTG